MQSHLFTASFPITEAVAVLLLEAHQACDGHKIARDLENHGNGEPVFGPIGYMPPATVSRNLRGAQ